METGHRLTEMQTALVAQVTSLAGVQTAQLSGFGQQMTHAAEVAETSARAQREEGSTLQQGNEAKLEQMRATVDEKLQATLEARLGESFRIVSERLEQVHRGSARCRRWPPASAT
jgi:DNA recombination protein RmuC